MIIVRDLSNRFQQMSGMPLSSNETKKMLQQAGIDTNSKQYKAAVKQMTTGCHGVGYTNIQSIQNVMRSFDKDGERINQFDGISGLVVTDKNRATKNRFISIPENSKEEMFALTKKEFIRENGVSNGNTTKRSEVYRHMYPQIKKDNRLAAGFTLRQYERQYREAFVAAVKQENPNWTLGMRIPQGALDEVTRESLDSIVEKSFR